MNILITSGSTCVPIDNVRKIGNIFSGKSGVKIAQYFLKEDHFVTLLNSKPLIQYIGHSDIQAMEWEFNNLNIIQYGTFDELKNSIQEELKPLVLSDGSKIKYDVIIHSSAVSDYGVGGVYEMGYDDLGHPMMWPINEPKIKSGRKELYLKLVPLPKIVDMIRDEWGFKGILVKFKLESEKSDKELIDIAIKSMKKSKANFIVANCLEWYSQRAIIISEDETIIPITRDNLNSTLYDLIEKKLSKMEI